MKQSYSTPKIEKLEFDYTDVVVASKNGKDKNKGDNGHHNGCGTTTLYNFNVNQGCNS